MFKFRHDDGEFRTAGVQVTSLMARGPNRTRMSSSSVFVKDGSVANKQIRKKTAKPRPAWLCHVITAPWLAKKRPQAIATCSPVRARSEFGR